MSENERTADGGSHVAIRGNVGRNKHCEPRLIRIHKAITLSCFALHLLQVNMLVIMFEATLSVFKQLTVFRIF